MSKSDDLDDNGRIADAAARLGNVVRIRIRIGQPMLGVRIPRRSQIELVGSGEAMAQAIESGWFEQCLATRICE